MVLTQETEIAAGPARVWEVLSDIGGWPEILASVDEVRAHQEGPPAVGQVYTLWQPRMPKVRWTITEWTPGESFTWRSTSPGARTTAAHRLTPLGADTTRLTLELDQRGPVNALLAPLTRRSAARLVALEAAGLKAAAEY